MLTSIVFLLQLRAAANPLPSPRHVMRTHHLMIALAGWLALGISANAADEGILFLHLRLDGERVTLVKQTRTRGTLKRPRGASTRGRGLELNLQTARGASLWSQVMPDPTVRRIEYEDPDRPGEMASREVPLTHVEFTVRVPAHRAAHSVILARRKSEDRKTKTAVTQPLGRIVLEPLPEEK